MAIPLHRFSNNNLVDGAFNHLCEHTYDAKTSDVDPDGDGEGGGD